VELDATDPIHQTTERAMKVAAPLLLIPLTLAAAGAAGLADWFAAPPRVDAETIVFTGTVTRAGGQPLFGAQVLERRSGAGDVTDSAGVYAFSVARTALVSNAELEAALLGFTTVRRTIAVAADTVRADFALAEAPIALNEVVVTGESRLGRRSALSSTVADASAAGEMERAGRVRAEVGQAANAIVAPSTFARHKVMAAPPVAPPPGTRVDPDWNREGYDAIEENAFLAVDANPVSTFSIDVDRASYGNVRRFIEDGQLPPKDAVRIEELINYFTYDDATPTGEHPFAVTTQLGAAPWKPGHQLLRIGLRSHAIDRSDMPPANLVFLIDVSGSMQSPDKLPLLKQAFGLLVDQLRPVDRVAIVVYAGAAGLVLPSTTGDHRDAIHAAIDGLEAGGSTAGGAGIRLAYDIAREHHVDGGNNRVILATDGDFNVGESSDGAMVELIEEKRAQGTFLTVLGFGTGNLQDAKMEKIANHGNGNYAYIDGAMEAKKVLVSELGGTLLTVAKDVKLQVEFNPARVRAYRLVGYENRLLAREDFDDDAKDAGEMGAGHSVTALYEIVPVGAETDVQIRGVDSLRYVSPTQPKPAAGSAELAYVKLRYKQPAGDVSTRFDHAVPDRATPASADFDFAAAVAAFGLTLRDSEHRGNASFDLSLALAKDAVGADRGGYRAEFIELVEKAKAVHRTIAANTTR
jgi:Ca-activated chloride channel homolog